MTHIESLFEVDKILEKKQVNGVTYYKVKWVGYSLKGATWEPRKNLKNVDWMVSKFEKQLANGEVSKKAVKTVVSATTSSSPTDTTATPEAKPEEKREKRKYVRKRAQNLEAYEDYGLIKAESHLKSARLPKSHKTRPPKPGPTPSLTFDEPSRIASVQKTANGLEVLIEWKARPDGEVLESSYHPARELRKHKQLARMLIDYYESIIKG